ncbi:MAG: MATE family efflux transporter, partial [Alsobacter sp.]
TDVLMMGRLGADAVAAGALGANLYFGFIIFGIGVMSAVSPLIAAARARTRPTPTRCGARCGRACGRRWRSRCRSGS